MKAICTNFLHLVAILSLITAFTSQLSYAQEKTISNTVNAKSKARWEFRTAPIALWARWFTFESVYRPSQNWATGPSLVWYNAESIGNILAPSYRGQALGWVVNYYFKSVSQNSGYLSFHSYYDKFTAYGHPRGVYDNEGVKANAAIGRMWRTFGTVIMAGIGPEYRSYEKIDLSFAQPVSSRETLWGPFVEFKLGLEF
ncbi:MAG: hypothetical protein A4S09_07110 [Proteobacteria bacterium SG_bin7]|nr:MAG: hypothetical protein A4S09_07110 [Proteobacteria bacterium SG_bin7]